MPAAITCASCKRPLRVPENVLGQLVQCPLCLDEFVAQADPVAAAAARAFEAPSKRAAVRPQPVAAPVPDEEVTAVEEVEEEAVWVEPVVEATSPKKPAHEKASPKALVFPVLVARDPDRVLRGRMEAELTADGLHLRKPRQAPAFAAVGGPARYLGANRLVVTVEGREVELTVVKPRTSVYHLARDTAGYLSGNGDFPDGRAYVLPLYLLAVPALLAALPLVGLPLGLLPEGGLSVFLWFAIPTALAIATLITALHPRLRPRSRLIGTAGLVGLGVLVSLFAYFLTPSSSVDPSLWRAYVPPDGSFRIKIPGSPTVAEGWIPDDHSNIPSKVTYTVDVKEPEVRFAVSVSANPTAKGGLNPPPGGNITNYQATNEAEIRLQHEYPTLGGGEERRGVWASGLPYYEVWYRSWSDGKRGILAARIYVGSDRTYTLIVVGPRVRVNSPDALKFFDSFGIMNQQPR